MSQEKEQSMPQRQDVEAQSHEVELPRQEKEPVPDVAPPEPLDEEPLGDLPEELSQDLVLGNWVMSILSDITPRA